MVAFNDRNEQSSTDRAMEKIHEEIKELGTERMEQIVNSVLVLVQEQIESAQGYFHDELQTEMIDGMDAETLNDLIWGVQEEFFGI